MFMQCFSETWKLKGFTRRRILRNAGLEHSLSFGDGGSDYWFQYRNRIDVSISTKVTPSVTT